jgi:hypothetical protein
MKHALGFFFFLLLVLATGCKKSRELWRNGNDLEVGEVSYKGDYIHINDAVLSRDEIYKLIKKMQI